MTVETEPFGREDRTSSQEIVTQIPGIRSIL
jgi:hypothetical protein